MLIRRTLLGHRFAIAKNLYPIRCIRSASTLRRHSMAIPIIVCGATEKVGTGVVQGLSPEIEVVFFHLASGDAKSELSSVLKGKIPDNPASTLGSGNLATLPRAVVLGGAFDVETVKSLKEQVESVEGAKPVTWLYLNQETPAPPLGPEYGKHVVGRVKQKVLQMEKDKELEQDGGVQMY